jgi:CRISPR-associated endonuclease Csn1
LQKEKVLLDRTCLRSKQKPICTSNFALDSSRQSIRRLREGKQAMSKLFSFDIGHASIGWAAFDIGNPHEPALQGCGTVIFPADDCLASQRRLFRRQRRHIRSTRMRIARMKEFLAGLKVLSQTELDEPGGPAPWKLAAEALCGHRILSMRELWDVLRWYAHNRGYDGNRKWSRAEIADPKDTEKEKNARDLMTRHGTATMAETICARLGIDPRSASKVTPHRAYKTLNAAFPRDVVVAEVRRILETESSRYPVIDTAFIESLCAEDNSPRGGLSVRDHLVSLGWTRELPTRYVGGLLFGQAVPRFDNRIIGVCPVDGGKLPLKACREFREFRWAMIVANIRVSDGASGMRPLTVPERAALTDSLRRVGSFTATQFKKEVAAVTKQGEGNTSAMMTDPNAADALVLDPPLAYVRTNSLMNVAWPMLPESLQRRILARMNRQKGITWGWIATQTEAPPSLADALVDAASPKGKKKHSKDAPVTWDTLSRRGVGPRWPAGRAPYSRQVMQQVVKEVMAGIHPAESGGVLFMTDERIARERAKTLDELTNNHLIRHRLRMLDRLIGDMVKRYAGGDPSRVSRCVVEVVRDLAEFSGKTNKEITTELNARLKHFNDVAARLQHDLQGINVSIGAGLIRKARIADDLGWKCPYTDHGFDAVTLARGGVDLDHVIPRSQRASDSLDSLVVTFPEVNRWKGNRTARQFIEDHAGEQVPGLPHLTIRSLASYDAMVASLAGEEKPTRFTRGPGSIGDKMRRWNRKQRMQRTTFNEPEFTPRDLTVTSHLTRLACRQIERSIPSLQKPGSITSIPGSVTGVVRKSWHCLGCLAQAAPLVMHEVPVWDDAGNPVIGKDGKQAARSLPRPKGEIRGVTHLHHALDAAVMGLAGMLLPRDGKLWEQIVTRKVPASEAAAFKKTYGWTGMLKLAPPKNGSGAHRLEVLDLPDSYKKTLADRLAERRVVKHVPADMRGARLKLNSWRVVSIANGRVELRQRSFDPKKNDPDTGARRRRLKYDHQAASKVVGLMPGKLAQTKAALVISDNYGVAVLDSDATSSRDAIRIIRFHQVKKQIASLTSENGGVTPLIIRNGNTIAIANGSYAGTWRVFKITSAKHGVEIDLGQPDTIEVLDKTHGHKRNVRLASLLAGGLTVAGRDLTGA